MLFFLTLNFKNFKAIKYRFILSSSFELFGSEVFGIVLIKTEYTLHIKEWNNDKKNFQRNFRY